MQRLKFSLIISAFILLASTTALFLQAQEPRDWTNLSGTVVLKSGTLDVDRTSKESENGTPTKVYVRVDSKHKYLQFEKISDVDRNYVRRELGLPEDVKGNSDEKSIKIISVDDGLKQPKNEKYAFLVAASHYDSGISSLLYPDADVEDIKKRLFELGFNAENVVVLRHGDDFGDFPTKKHIEERYKQFLSRVQSGDLVFVYLSGHGLQLNQSDVSYFAPVDVDLNDIENSSVSINEMMKKLADSKAEFRWMIVDACRNDPNNRKSIFTQKAPGARGMSKLEDIPDSISLLQSCQPGACSYEGGGNKYPDVHNGVFTLALLEALGEDGKGDVNKDGVVSFLEICQYVSKRTNVLANLYHHEEQIPKLRGDFTDFAFLEVGKNEAAQAYQDGLELFDQADYSGALAKFVLACQKDRENQEYARMLGVVKKIVDDARKVEKTEAERKAAEERAARLATEKAEEERKRKEAEKQASHITEPSSSSTSSVVEKPNSPSDSSDAWSGTFQAGDRKTLTYKGVEFAFRYCPAGTFTMGSPKSEEGRSDNETQRSVTIKDGFWICETETTQEQWDAAGTQKEHDCEFSGEKLPVENVSLNECVAFIQELNKLKITPKGWRFELPTEEQWEYACRAGATGSTYGVPLNECAWYDEDRLKGSTHQVGMKKPNAWGVYDMLGNVLEWTITKYENAALLDANSVFSLVNRGGSWNSDAQFCRPAKRRHDPAFSYYDNLGFRIVLVRSQLK